MSDFDLRCHETSAVAREILRRDLDAIVRTVQTLALDDRSRLGEPCGAADRALINVARALVRAALPLAEEFLAHDMPVECLEDLNHAIHQLEAALGPRPAIKGANEPEPRGTAVS